MHFSFPVTQTQSPELKVLSFNIHKGLGWTRHDSMLNQIRRVMRLLSPDIVLLQEVCGSQFEFLAEEIWPHFRYGKNAVYAKGCHGNAILSKYPISFDLNINISMGSYERRGFLHSIIQPPHLDYPLHLICVHLGLFKTDRYKQLDEIIKYVNTMIPAHEYLIIGGDFNDWGGHATEPLVDGLGLQEAFLHHKGAYAKTFPAWVPILRLDRVYSRGFVTHEAERLTHQTWKLLSDHIAINVRLKPHFILPR